MQVTTKTAKYELRDIGDGRVGIYCDDEMIDWANSYADAAKRIIDREAKDADRD